jgi:hypothetical protein
LTLGALEPIVAIAAMLIVEHMFWFGARAVADSAVVLALFADTAGDHFLMLNVFNDYESNGRTVAWSSVNCVQLCADSQATQMRQQWLDIVQSLHNAAATCPATNTHAMVAEAATRHAMWCVLMHGFVLNIAVWQGDDASYRLLLPNDKNGTCTNTLNIHPSSSFFASRPEIVFFHEVAATLHLYMRHVTRIDSTLLQEALGNMASASLPANGLG